MEKKKRPASDTAMVGAARARLCARGAGTSKGRKAIDAVCRLVQKKKKNENGHDREQEDGPKKGGGSLFSHSPPRYGHGYEQDTGRAPKHAWTSYVYYHYYYYAPSPPSEPK